MRKLFTDVNAGAHADANFGCGVGGDESGLGLAPH